MTPKNIEANLDIFAMRARSHEGKLQVHLAQLKYLLPRLVGQGIMLSRQVLADDLRSLKEDLERERNSES